MEKAKYIVYNSEIGLPVVQIFSPLLQHSKVAAALNIPRESLLSAGFVAKCPVKEMLVCYGESVSLMVESNPDRDSKLVQDLLES